MKLTIRQQNQLLRHSNLRYATFFVAILCLVCCGMSNAPSRSSSGTLPPDSKYSIEATLAEIKYAYEARNVRDTAALLANEFEGRLNFINSLQDYFLSIKEVQIDFVVDTVTSEKDKVSVRLHWFKKSIDNSGTFSKVKGSSQLVFHKKPGRLKLLYIRQDNPFF